MSDDILLRLRLDPGNVDAGLKQLKKSAQDLDGSLSAMAGTGPMEAKVKGIGSAIIANVDQIEARYKRLADKLNTIQKRRDDIAMPTGTSESKTKYDSQVAASLASEQKVIAEMSALGKAMNRFQMQVMKASIGVAGPAKDTLLSNPTLGSFSGGGADAAMAALVAAIKQEELRVRGDTAAAKVAAAKKRKAEKAAEDADDSALKSRIAAQKKESARAEQIRQWGLQGQIAASARQIKIDRDREKQDRKDEKQAQKDAARAMTPAVAAQDILAERKAIADAAKMQEKAMRDFAIKEQQANLHIEAAKKKLAAAMEKEVELRLAAGRSKNEYEFAVKGQSDAKAMYDKRIADQMARNAEKALAREAKQASNADGRRLDDTLLTAERSSLQLKIAELKRNISITPATPGFARARATMEAELNGLVAKRNEVEQKHFAAMARADAAELALKEKAIRDQQKLDAIRAAAKIAMDSQRHKVAVADKNYSTAAAAHREYAGGTMMTPTGPVRFDGKLKDLQRNLDWATNQSKSAADEFAKLSEASKRAAKAAEDNAKMGEHQRNILMSPANQDRARKLVEREQGIGKLSLADKLAAEATERQIAAAKARIALYGEDLARAAKLHNKMTRADFDTTGLSDQDLRKLKLSRLKDMETQLKTSVGTPAQAARSSGTGAPPPEIIPPGLNRVVGQMNLRGLPGIFNALNGNMGALAQKLREGATGVANLASKFTEAGGSMIHFVDKAAFGLWKVQGAVRLVMGVWEQFMEVLSKGEQILRLEHAFETMTRGAGASMEKLRESTKNMVSDEGIQKLANFGVQQKMTGEELEMIMRRASGAALVTGRTTEDITRRFVEGIAKQEREIMDEATVIMSNASVIWNKEAKRLGKKASDLTQQEKQKAYMKDFIQQSAHLERVAANFPDKLAKIGQAQTMMANAWNTLWGQIAKTFAESGTLDQMGEFISKVTSKLGSISGNEQAIVWAKQFGDLMTEMARAALTAGGALTPLAQLIPLLTNALSAMNGPLGTVINLWSRFQTMKLEGIGAVLGLGGMAGGAIFGDESLEAKSTNMFLDAGRGISQAMGMPKDETEDRLDIKYTKKARDAMAALDRGELGPKAEFQTAAKDAKEYAKALSYIYSEEKRLLDLKNSNDQKPKLSDTGTNYQNALDATRQGVVGMAKSGNIVDVAGAAFDVNIGQSRAAAERDAAKLELAKLIEWRDYRREQAKVAKEAFDAFDPNVEYSGAEGGIRSTVKMSRFEEIKRERENNLVPDFMEPLTFHGVTDDNAAQYASLIKDMQEKEMASFDLEQKASALEKSLSEARVSIESARDSQDKFLASFDALNEADAKAMSQDLYEKTMVTIPGRLQDRVSLKDFIGSRSTLRAGEVDEYGPEKQIGKGHVTDLEKTKRIADEFTIDPARKKDAEGIEKYKQEAVKTNLEAFRRLEVSLLDEQFKLQREEAAMLQTFEAKSLEMATSYALEMMNSYLLDGTAESKAIADQIRAAVEGKSYTSTSELLAALPEGQAAGIENAISEAQHVGEQLIQTNANRIEAQLKDAQAMIAELEKRLKTKGGRKKEQKFILPELMDLAESFTLEAGGSSAAQAKNMNRDGLGSKPGEGKFLMETERLAAGYMGRLSSETAEAFERGIKVVIDDDVKARIKSIVDDNQRLQMEIMQEAVASGSQGEFEKAKARIAAAQAAIEKTDLLSHYEESAGIQKLTQSRNDQLQIEADLWTQKANAIKIAKTAAESADQADYEYRKGVADRMMASREYAMAMTGPSSQFGSYGMTMEEVDPNDIPDYMRIQAQDPLSAMKKEEWNRKRDAIKKERDERLKELRETHRASGVLGATDMGSLWEGEASIKKEAESKLGSVQLEEDADGLAQSRALSQRYYEEVKKPWENMGMDLTGMFAESLAFGMNDMWVAALNDAEDWTESMMALFENMTGAIGGMLQETASATIAAYTGSPLLGKISGGLIKGTWDAIMNLFKKKEKKEDDQNRRAERELRRKETKKTDNFTVVLVNNGLSVNRDTANQVGAAVNAYVNGGGKLKNSR